MTNNLEHPFNNKVEYGLRALTLLTCGFPKKYDLNELIYLDYLLVHSGDFEASLKSLHAPTPNRKEEVYVRRKLLENGLELFVKKGLLEQLYLPDGIYYVATEYSEPFLDLLLEEYALLLKKRAIWVIGKFGMLKEANLRKLIADSKEYSDQEIAFEVNFVRT